MFQLFKNHLLAGSFATPQAALQAWNSVSAAGWKPTMLANGSPMSHAQLVAIANY